MREKRRLRKELKLEALQEKIDELEQDVRKTESLLMRIIDILKKMPIDPY